MQHERTRDGAEARERQRAEAAGQGHVFRFWDRLDRAGRANLLAQLAGVDFELVRSLAADLQQADDRAAVHEAVQLEPPELFPLARDERQAAHAAAAVQRGEALLAEGRVGYVLVAGGQASRLGYDGPKGAFPVGPVSGRTLFEFHAARLRAAAARYGSQPAWYVMTSPANDAATRAFFDERDACGLGRENVFFFSQEMLPALDDEGRILLSAPDALFLAPNGHGGVLLALERSGALADMRARGMDVISYFQVDNPLARPADPLFLGLHALVGAGMSTKVVKKRDPDEKVGVIGRIDGAMGCIEYSDLSEAERHAVDESGELRFRAGNIAVHALQRDFVHGLTVGGLELPWHRARKRMKVLDDSGTVVEQFGTKFESFVFDALSRSPASVTLEVERALEFSPVKNAAGEDSPASCRRDLCRMFAGWVADTGGALPAPDADGLHAVEVAPECAENLEEFRLRDATPRIGPDGHLYES